jgi:hypothetical protein
MTSSKVNSYPFSSIRFNNNCTLRALIPKPKKILLSGFYKKFHIEFPFLCLNASGINVHDDTAQIPGMGVQVPAVDYV